MRSVLSDHPTSFTITVTSDGGDSGDSEYSKQHRGCRLAFESVCLESRYISVASMSSTVRKASSVVMYLLRPHIQSVAPTFRHRLFFLPFFAIGPPAGRL